MARIKIESIAEELQPDGWKVLSTEYQNLDTEMEFMCAEGHKVYAPWKKIRTNRECPVCKQNKYKDVTKTIIPKIRGKPRIIGLDQASHITGYSIFDGKELVYYGVFETSNTEDEITRFNEIKIWLISIIENWKPDVIGIEFCPLNAFPLVSGVNFKY